MNVLAHRYVVSSMPPCGLPPWSVNRSVNKLLKTANTKFADHPRPYMGVLSHEPERFASTAHHGGSTGFGRLAIPRLLNSFRTTKNEEQLVLSLKTLVELVQDPEKIAEALDLHVLNPLPRLLNHTCPVVQSYSLALLIQISRLPIGKIKIVSRKPLINRIMQAFQAKDFMVRDMACSLINNLSSNWIVVDRLVDLGFVKLSMEALKRFIVDPLLHKTEIVSLLRALINLTDREEAVWEVIRFDAVHVLNPLLSHENADIRLATVDLFVNMFSSPLGMIKDLAASMGKFILSALEKEQEDPPYEMISILALTSINSEARSIVLNSEKVIKTLLDLYRRPKIPISLRLSVHNVLTIAAEIPLARGVLLKHMNDLAQAKMFKLIPEELMDSLINVICERSSS